MKRAVSLILAIILLSLSAYAKDIQAEISSDLDLESAKDDIPESARDHGVDLSPSNTPTANGLTLTSIFKAAVTSVFDALETEVPFVLSTSALLVVLSIIRSLADPSKTALSTAIDFASSACISTVILRHVFSAFSRASEYVEEVSAFMTGLLPFFASISAVAGEFTTGAVQRALLGGAITVIQNFVSDVTIPICEVVIALSIVGYISNLSFSAITSLISATAVKIITVTGSIMCTILYFQNAVTSVTDSLALRSLKLAAGSFIPIVGSFVSEASGTLVTGARLVKSTFGVFAIAVLIYATVRPLVNFFIIKLSVRLASAIASLIGCTRESKIMTDVASVYNVLSAVMIWSACFFGFFITVFIKSEV